jgi:hypothetical protein
MTNTQLNLNTDSLTFDMVVAALHEGDILEKRHLTMQAGFWIIFW